MPLGTPAIATPSTFDLRAVQLAVNNIRARLVAADSAILALQTGTDAATQAATIAQLQALLTSLQSRISVLEGSLGAGDIVTLTAGAPVAAFDAMVPTGANEAKPADAADPEEIFAVLGVARAAAAQGSSVSIQRRGALSIPGAAFDTGRAVYVGLGGLTQSPAYGTYSIPVGVAISSSAIWVAPGHPALMSPGLYGSVFDDFVPPTWGLMRERLTLLQTLLDEPNGFVVKVGSQLVTRKLVVATGTALHILNDDGALGDPIFTP